MMKVSIHAPTKGATGAVTDMIKDLAVSIHAPTKGATLASQTDTTMTLLFQSTLLRKERRMTAEQEQQLNQFQSTLLRKERQQFDVSLFSAAAVSIHAPTKGATV